MELVGCSNPGWHFSLTRIKQINDMYSVMGKLDQNYDYTYIELQTEIEKECRDVDKSKVRMFIPFLIKMGILKANHGRLNELFTPFGEKFFAFLDLYIKINFSENKKAIGISKNILSYFLINGYKNLLYDEEDKIYFYLLKILCNVKYIVKDEFFLITTVLENKKNENENIKTTEIIKLITDYRKGNIEKLDIKKNINAFNYIMPFVLSCNLVLLKDDKYYLNSDKLKLLGADFHG